MSHVVRRAFPYAAIAVGLAALAWAVSFGTLPKADFTFDNGNEIKTADPARATGQPEHRILNALFEGLLRSLPEEDWQRYRPGENVPMKPQPGMAERFEHSEDGLTYTFYLRRNAQWSNGQPVTAHDFVWSWRRTLHPETAGEYAYQLYYLKGAEAYNTAQVNEGDNVEVEIDNTRRNPLQAFPRGTIVRGKVTKVLKPSKPAILAEGAKADKKEKEKAERQWKDRWTYVVTVRYATPSSGDRRPNRFVAGNTYTFSRQPEGAPRVPNHDVIRALNILPEFETTVGARAESPHKLVVTLRAPTPYFPELVAFYPYFPVNPACVEQYGSPNWTKPEYMVCNGPFKMEFRRLRDRIRLVKNPRYWAADKVRLNVVDALAVRSETTTLNMYLNDQLDWGTQVPAAMIPEIKAKLGTEFRTSPELTVYFYRVNVTRPGLDNKLVRQALNLAIDKKNICEVITRAGEVPASAVVPPGLPGYSSPGGGQYNPQQARKLLAEAGYPHGRGLPTIEILYNDLDIHRTIAERVQQLWRENLGIDVRLRVLEWQVYLDAQMKLDYMVSRAGWVADYPDPNTFLDMWTSYSQQNSTGWKHARYDELIAQAGREEDPAKRMAILAEAEQILLDECPILPIYWRVSKNLVKPHVRGWFNTAQDDHPLTLIWIDRSPAALAAKK